MRLLIIGGNRFVGAELVSRAVLEGHDVTVVALDPPNIRARSHVRFIRADRNNTEELCAGLKGLEFDAVLDNIAFAPPHIEIMLEVLQGRIGRYVLTSTVDIYPREVTRISSEHHELLSPSDLDNPPHGEHYFRGKRGCEKVLRQSGVPWSVIRPAIVFGRSDPIPPAPRILHPIGHHYGRSLFLPCRVLDGGPVLLRRSDRRVFSLAGSQDVASALVLVAGHPDAAGRAFNVAGDEIWTSERLIQALCAAAGTLPAVVRVSDEELETAGLGDYDSPYGRVKWWSVVDNRRLKSLGWSPTPASVQLAKLVEAVPPRAQRPFYGRRMKEIALAKQILRRQQALPVWGIEGLQTSGTGGASLISPSASPLLKGRFTDARAKNWKKSLNHAHIATPLPSEDHFRQFLGRIVSSIGIGTHRGEPDAGTDALYSESIACALKGGINVVDTAINYRWMRAERTVGKILAELHGQGVDREAVCLCSKGGFVPQDADDPRPLQQYIQEEFVAPGLIEMKEADRRHSIRPGFIRKLVGMSLRNLGVEHIDVYYLHNPERALAWMGADIFYATLRETFAVLEQSAADGHIGCYGIATWKGLRTSPANEEYLSLARIYAVAKEAGGPEHHFKAVQFPLNLSSREARQRKNQEVGGRKMTLLEAAAELGLSTFTSASISRGQDLPQEMMERLASCRTEMDVQQIALNVIRSTPGVGTALVGMRRRVHVEKALVVAASGLMDPDSIAGVYGESDG